MSSSQILSFCNLLYFYCNVKNCSWEGFSFVAFRQGSSHCSVLPRYLGVLADFSHYKCRKLLPFFLYFYIFSDEASSIFHVVHCQSLCPARFDSFLPLIVFSGLYGAKIFLWLFLHFWIDKEGKLW